MLSSGHKTYCMAASILIVLTLILCSLNAQDQDLIVSKRNITAGGLNSVTLDCGIGIIAFANPPGHNSEGRNDTIVVYENPDLFSNVSGLVLYSEKDHGWSYAVAGRFSMQPNVLEFDYEESGVPFDTILTSNRWARAILGFRGNGEAVSGWVNLDSSNIRYLLWSQELPRHDLFFFRKIAPVFYDCPHGNIINWEVKSTPVFDYIMHPIDVNPPWMYVRVARPSDICGSEVQSDTLRAWIRYIQENGRPAVWYYTRGC